MYCLDKFQALLSDFLGIDIKTLPKLEDNLKKAGYIGIQKGKEVEYFSKGLSEFGENYPQYYHKPQEAIAHLLETKEGQVAGAFYKEELGDIDVVWGDSHFGLQHILERRTQDFIKEGLSEAEAKAKAREFVESIPKIIESGKVVKDDKGRLRIEFDNFIVGIKDNWKGKPTNKWIVTSYTKKEGGESLYTSSPITKGETLPLNSKADSTIDSKLLSKVQSKFKYDEKKASDLLEWHKDSSPITKDKDGLPKVFYHGSKAGNIKEFKSEFDESGLGFWFVDDIEYAKRVDDNLYEVFLNVKNPIDFRGGDNPNYPYKLQEEMDKLGLSLERYTYQTEKTKEFLQSKGYDALILDGSNKEHPFIAIFDSNQIKHINNKGSYTDSSGNITSTKPKDTQAEHRYFNEASPNIYQSNAHIGSGLVSGTLAGVERDENGNIVGFDPAKFALGFLGGAVGSKGVQVMAKKYAIMRKMNAKNNDKKLYDTLKLIDTSPKFGSKMNLIGLENLNSDVLAYALAKNKRVGINKLDENIAKGLGFKYPNDVRRTIQPDEIIHTLERHGLQSDLVKLSGQKPVTLEEIAKYQEYSDNADFKGKSLDKSNNQVLVSAKQVSDDFYVVIEQIRKKQNELSYKNMYFGKGKIDKKILGEITKLPASS